MTLQSARVATAGVAAYLIGFSFFAAYFKDTMLAIILYGVGMLFLGVRIGIGAGEELER